MQASVKDVTPPVLTESVVSDSVHHLGEGFLLDLHLSHHLVSEIKSGLSIIEILMFHFGNRLV